MKKRPHIIILCPDSWRGDVLGHLGDKAAVTPNLDALAGTDAVSFRHAFTQAPVCVPSRCSFLTGWYPHVRGHRTQAHMLAPDEPMLLRFLKESGYHVWWGGKNDVVRRDRQMDYCDVRYKAPGPIQPDPHSWEDWRGEPDSDNYFSFYLGRLEKGPDHDLYWDNDAANSQGAVEQIKSAPKDKPLCLYLALGSPHPPYAVEEPWFSRIDRSKLPARTLPPADWKGKAGLLAGIQKLQAMGGWDESRWQELRAVYYGMCARTDHLAGQVIHALKDAGMYEDSAIFFFSDHGDFTGDFGLVEKTQNTFEDCITRVPFLLKPPAGVECKPGIRDSLVELVDFRATVDDFAGLQPDFNHFGKSLRPLLKGETTHREAVFCEGGRIPGEAHATEAEYVEVKDGKSSLYWPRLSLEAREEQPFLHGKATMCRTADYKYVRRLYETDELYDLKDDPKELHNRIDDPALSVVLADLKERLLTFYQHTGDVVPHAKDSR
jgi:arylsulfatase A-like enzyme